MLNRFDLLIANDFSYVRCDQGETSVPFELIAERYERESMALAANQPFSGWDHIFAEHQTQRLNQPCIPSTGQDI